MSCPSGFSDSEKEKLKQEIVNYGLTMPDTYKDRPFYDHPWAGVRCKRNRRMILESYDLVKDIRG